MDTTPSANEVESGPVQPQAGIRSLIVFLLFAAACFCLVYFTPLRQYVHTDNISRLVGHLGPWGPVVIMLIGIFSPLLFLPRWPIAFVSGLLYGVLWGTVLANIASTIGAYLHFVLARSLLKPSSDRLRRRYGIHDMHVPNDKLFVILFALRAFPLSNFVATNLLAGALSIHMGTYLSASFLGMIPSTLMYAAAGKLMKNPSTEFYVLTVAVLVVLIVGTLIARKRFMPWLKRLAGER